LPSRTPAEPWWPPMRPGLRPTGSAPTRTRCSRASAPTPPATPTSCAPTSAPGPSASPTPPATTSPNSAPSPALHRHRRERNAATHHVVTAPFRPYLDPQQRNSTAVNGQVSHGHGQRQTDLND
jgi:hypothetical protein